MCDGVTIPAHFTPDIYCHLIGMPMALRDLQLIDTDVFNSISWMLENDVDELGFSFEAEIEGEYGAGPTVVKELKPNGSNIPVTNGNKQEFVELKGTDAGGLKVQGQHDVIKEKERAASERKRKLEQVTNQKLEFVRTIPKDAMRADFAQIVGNMEKKNREFVRTQPRNIGVNFQIVGDTFTFHMRINGQNIYTGHLVVVFSSLSRESFSGVITSIEEDEILVRCGNGTKFAFTAELVRSGRVTVTRDDEGIAAAEAIKEAAKIFSVQMM